MDSHVTSHLLDNLAHRLDFHKEVHQHRHSHKLQIVSNRLNPEFRMGIMPMVHRIGNLNDRRRLDRLPADLVQGRYLTPLRETAVMLSIRSPRMDMCLQPLRSGNVSDDYSFVGMGFKVFRFISGYTHEVNFLFFSFFFFFFSASLSFAPNLI